MIKSMTGFGQTVLDTGTSQVHVEIRCLNSKFLDLTLRLPKAFSDKELEIRNLVSELLERGKVSILIEYARTGEEEIKQSYNAALFRSYYAELRKLADSVNDAGASIFNLALDSPEVIQVKLREEASEQEWQTLKETFLQTVKKCEAFRVKEGMVLEKMLGGCCEKIRAGLVEIEQLDPERITRLRERLKGNVSNFLGDEGYDSNRLEQEIIFYIEKLDINEEKVRLNSHLDYFIEVLHEPQANGKKLSFISQEIGREINTIGSKANDARIQKHVVVMKEELEKIKEQLNNVL